MAENLDVINAAISLLIRAALLAALNQRHTDFQSEVMVCKCL